VHCHRNSELIDRFGPLPEEVRHLLDIVAVKALCRTALVEKIDAGPKGATLTFRNNLFPNPAGLVRLISLSAPRRPRAGRRRT